MKNLTLSFILFILAQISYAQMLYGVRAGGNLSDQKYKMMDIANNSKAVNMYGGVFAQKERLGKSFYRAELNYSQKGVRYTSFSLNPVHKNIRFNYATLNLLYGYHFSPKFSLLAGPEIGYLTHISKEQSYRSYYPERFYNKWDLAADLGLEYKIHPKLNVEARYSYGFRMLLKEEYRNRPYPDWSRSPESRNGGNHVLSVGLNYLIFKK